MQLRSDHELTTIGICLRWSFAPASFDAKFTLQDADEFGIPDIAQVEAVDLNQHYTLFLSFHEFGGGMLEAIDTCY